MANYRRSRPEDLDLNGKPPVVNLAGRFTKNGKPAAPPAPTGPHHPRTRTWVASKPSHVSLFPPDRNSSLMIKADLRERGHTLG